MVQLAKPYTCADLTCFVQELGCIIIPPYSTYPHGRFWCLASCRFLAAMRRCSCTFISCNQLVVKVKAPAAPTHPCSHSPPGHLAFPRGQKKSPQRLAGATTPSDTLPWSLAELDPDSLHPELPALNAIEKHRRDVAITNRGQSGESEVQ